jgi:hypothetical protein
MTAPRPGRTADAVAHGAERVMLRCALPGATRSSRNRRLAQGLVLGWVRSRWPRLMPSDAELAQERFRCVLSDRRLSIASSAGGNVWMLEVAYDERDGARTWITRALVADTGSVDVVGLQTTCQDRAGGPMVVAPPKVLGSWVDRLELLDGEVPVLAVPRRVDEEDHLADFRVHLMSPERTLPIVALGNKGQSRYYGVDPGGLAESLRGMAHVVCLSPPIVAALRREFGPALAPVAGAARIYRPGFQAGADPREHPLVRNLAMPDGSSPPPAAFRRLLCQRVCALSAAAPTAFAALFGVPA